jgi:A/G-specific adenine glycosylase
METEWTVTAFPMRIDRKKAREELDVINIVEWRRNVTSDERLFLLIRRPETGES